MLTIPEQLCEAGKIMFEKRLTDMAGGNISARVDDMRVYEPALFRLAPALAAHPG